MNKVRGPAEFKFNSVGDGTIEMVIYSGNQPVAAVRLQPSEISGIVSHLMRTAHASFTATDKILGELPNESKITLPIPINNLLIGITGTQGEKAVIIRSGEVVIGLTVRDSELRALGRSLAAASWKAQSSIGSRDLLRILVADCFRDLREWGRMFRARAEAASRRRAVSLWSNVSGSSFRPFRTIEISPGDVAPKNEAIGQCIYCDATDYSTYSKKPGIRTHPFGGEHIVPEGIGGTIELPEASCQRCEEITGALVEGRVLGITLKALRVHLKLKKSGSGPHPDKLPLSATIGGVERRIDIPADDYPIVFSMIRFGPPNVSKENKEQGRALNGVVVATLKYDQRKLQRQYGITGFATAAWDTRMFCRMLAKIGHSFAVAELGLPGNKFRPMLLDLILNGSAGGMNLIGGPQEWEIDPPSKSLHQIALGYQRIEKKNYLVVRVRLFARHGGTTSYVVVGESLESPIARFRRVFSSRISSMLSR